MDVSGYFQGGVGPKAARCERELDDENRGGAAVMETQNNVRFRADWSAILGRGSSSWPQIVELSVLDANQEVVDVEVWSSWCGGQVTRRRGRC